MEDKALLTEAYQLVSELNQTIQSCKQGLPDDLRLQQNIDEILRALKKADKLDNAILIELESFYQRTSLLIGLGSLKLNDQARTAWRNYDKFHYDHVKHTLTLYGPVLGFKNRGFSGLILTNFLKKSMMIATIFGGKGDMNN